MLSTMKEVPCKFNEKKLQYDLKTITYDKYIVRFENKKVICSGDFIFISNPHGSIFATHDLKDFVLIGTGEIQASLDGTIIVENGESYWIYRNGIKILLYFYIEDDKLVYYHNEKHDLQKVKVRIMSYEKLFVAVSAMNVLFIELSGSTDTQHRFCGFITDFNVIKSNGIEFIVFKYCKYGETRISLFYRNMLISSNITLENMHSNPIIFFDNQKYHYDAQMKNNLSVNNKTENNNLCFKEHDVGTEINNTCFHCEIIPEPNNIINIQEKSKKNDKHLFKMDTLERKSFDIASFESKIAFLRSVFSGKEYNIVGENIESLIHMSKSISSISSNKAANAVLSIDEFRKRSFFYDSTSTVFSKKYLKMKFRSKLTEDEQAFLNRQYERIFYYNDKIRNSRNLAYRIITKEKEYRCDFDPKVLFKQMMEYNKMFLSIVNTYFDDNRMNDILQLMMEDSVVIYPDINDTNNFRQKAFIVRICSGVGAFILNCKAYYYHGIYRSSPKTNSVLLSEKINKNLVFLNSATVSSYFKVPSSADIYEELGYMFGKGLLSGMDNSSLQKYINMIASASESVLKFIYLVISTYNIPRNNTINTILKSGIESRNIDVKIASMCGLAIYNAKTHDRFIIETLEVEANRYGPVNTDKTNVFYCREYRKISAICIGLISEKPIVRSYSDSFCELLITGLSSIGKSTDPQIFYRSADCRPEEIFYSELFTLTSNFHTKPESLEFSIAMPNSLLDYYKNAAKILYISLYYVQNAIEPSEQIYSKIFDLALKLEDMHSKESMMLFGFILASLSIMKMGSSDLKLLRVLRRQVLKTKDIKSMHEYTVFDPKKKNFVSFKGCGMGQMQLYKICIGILCVNFGLSRLNRKYIKNLIVTFFLSEAQSIEFSFLDVLRMHIARCFHEDAKISENFEKIVADLDLRIERKKVKKLFYKEFEKLEDVDKKIVIDILSDYYENYYFSDKKYQSDVFKIRSVFDLRILAKLLLISK